MENHVFAKASLALSGSGYSVMKTIVKPKKMKVAMMLMGRAIKSSLKNSFVNFTTLRQEIFIGPSLWLVLEIQLSC